MTLATQLGGCRQLGACRPRRAGRLTASPARALSPEQQQHAMQKQLRLSQDRATAAEKRRSERAAGQADAAAAAEAPKLTRREQRAARRAAAREADAASQQQSAAAQNELAARLGSLDEQALASALRVQLRQSGTFDEAGGAERGLLADIRGLETTDEEVDGASTGANHAAHPLASGSRAAAVFEDGCLLYTSDSLGAGGVEETLTA